MNTVLLNAAAEMPALKHTLNTLALIDIAWAEIDAAEKRWPEKAQQLGHAFTVVRPRHQFPYSDLTFRIHCKDLLERIVRDRDTRPGTDGELLEALMYTSLRAPLQQDYALVMEKIMRKWDVMPPGIGDGIWRESWDGRLDDIISEAQRKLTCKDRKLNCVEAILIPRERSMTLF